jgi:alcohol dehydrogenase (NADP+)
MNRTFSLGCHTGPFGTAKTPSRIKANLEGDFHLSDEDMKKIQGIDKKLRFNDSSADFGRDFFTDLEGKGSV